MSALPSIKALYNSTELALKNDRLTVLLNQEPKKEWIKTHPFISNYKYVPIEIVEYLLKSIFKKYSIEITGQGQCFNGVWVTVRVHYLNPITGEMDFHDGIGATELQTAKGTSPADLANINNGALGMAFPIAKTRAIKDACDHFGKLFGSDLNRKVQIDYVQDVSLIPMDNQHPNWFKVLDALKSGNYTIEDIKKKYDITQETEAELWKHLS
jgi:hypothetical protein